MLSIIEENKTGLFFNVGSVAELTDCILWAVEHEAEMTEFGNAARKEYSEKYTNEVNCKQSADLYEEAVSCKQLFMKDASSLTHTQPSVKIA